MLTKHSMPAAVSHISLLIPTTYRTLAGVKDKLEAHDNCVRVGSSLRNDCAKHLYPRAR